MIRRPHDRTITASANYRQRDWMDFVDSSASTEFFPDQRTHHHRIVVRHFTQGIHDMEPFRRNQLFGLRIVLRSKSRHCRLTVHNLTSQDLAVHFQRAPLLDQRLGLRRRNAMELRELLQSSRLNQLPIRHDAESLEMRGPVLAEVDVLDVSTLRDRAIQCPVVESKILLLKLRL